MTQLQDALKRAKGLLGIEPESGPEDQQDILEDFDKLVAEARAYVVANWKTMDPEVEMEIELKAGEFKVTFKAGD